MSIGPSRNPAGHFGARSYRAVHIERPECSEQRTIQERSPAWIEDAGSAARARDHVPKPDVLRRADAAVFSGTIQHLRLHPQRASLRFGVPERLSLCAAADQIDSLKLLPGLVAFAGGYPGESPGVDLRCRTPFVVRRGRQGLQRAGDAMRGDQMPGIEFAEEIHSPIKQLECIV